QTDSWFVRIWVENGIVGLIIHALLLAYVLVIGYVKSGKIKDPDLRQKMIALYGGFIGIISASFGNPIFGQAPLGALMYISMAMLCVGDDYEKEEEMKIPGQALRPGR